MCIMRIKDMLQRTSKTGTTYYQFSVETSDGLTSLGWRYFDNARDEFYRRKPEPAVLVPSTTIGNGRRMNMIDIPEAIYWDILREVQRLIQRGEFYRPIGT